MGRRSRYRTAARDFEHDELTYQINGAAFEVHTALGPGLFERVYENALCVALARRGLREAGTRC